MKRYTLCLGCILAAVFGFCAIVFNIEKATGQTGSTSSSSSSSGSVVINSGFTGSWKAKVIKNTSSSSSSGDIASPNPEPTVSMHKGNDHGMSSGSGSSEAEHGSSSGSPEIEDNHGSSSGAVGSGHGPDDFPVMGGPQGENKGSKTITLKLCVVNNSVNGVIEQGGVINKGRITASTVISENEVSLTIQDKKGKTIVANLKLIGDRQLQITFDSGLKADGRKLNPFKACFAPGKDKGGKGMSHPEGSPEPSPVSSPDGSSSGSIVLEPK